MSSASSLSCASNAGNSSASTSSGVRRACATRTAPATAGRRWRTSSAWSARTRCRRRGDRPRATSPGRRLRAASALGAARRSARPAAAGTPNVTSASRPGDVDTSATPTTRSPKSSGCWSASAMTVMPPIECPTSTTLPVGAVASRTASRSRPSWSMVAFSALPRPRPAVAALVPEDQPASQVGEVAALVVPAVLVQRQPVAEDDRHRRPLAGRRAAGPRPRRAASTPSVAVTGTTVPRSSPKRLVGLRVVGAAERAAHGVPLGGQPDGCSGDHHTGGSADHRGPPAPRRHRRPAHPRPPHAPRPT